MNKSQNEKVISSFYSHKMYVLAFQSCERDHAWTGRLPHTLPTWGQHLHVNRPLKTILTNIVDHLTTHLICPNSSQNIISEHFLLMIILLTTLQLFHSNSLNSIETLCEKLEKHTSSREAKLLNL